MTHQQLFIPPKAYGSVNPKSNELSKDHMPDWEADVSFSLPNNHKTSLNSIQLNCVAYHDYLSIFKRLAAHTQQQTPLGDKSALLCGISLHGWSRGSAWSHG